MTRPTQKENSSSLDLLSLLLLRDDDDSNSLRASYSAENMQLCPSTTTISSEMVLSPAQKVVECRSDAMCSIIACDLRIFAFLSWCVSIAGRP